MDGHTILSKRPRSTTTSLGSTQNATVTATRQALARIDHACVQRHRTNIKHVQRKHTDAMMTSACTHRSRVHSTNTRNIKHVRRKHTDAWIVSGIKCRHHHLQKRIDATIVRSNDNMDATQTYIMLRKKTSQRCALDF